MASEGDILRVALVDDRGS